MKNLFVHILVILVLVNLLVACNLPPNSSLHVTSHDTVQQSLSQTNDTHHLLGSQVLAFNSNRDFNAEIYLMKGDGVDQVRITNDIGDDLFPTWSPNGNKIAYVSDRAVAGNSEILVMNLATKEQINITNHPAEDTMPTWSPDGTQIAFVSGRDGNLELYLMQVDGAHVKRLTNSFANELMPAWSPDSSRLVYVADAGNVTTIYIMELETGQITPLIDNTANLLTPTWSPDGERVAFAMQGENGKFSIIVKGINSSETFILTRNSVDNLSPSWSPDGRYIAFASGDSGLYEIYVMEQDGSHISQLTNNPGKNNGNPIWFPLLDNSEVVYDQFAVIENSASTNVFYIVREGDTLSDLADYYGVSIDSISTYNQVVEPGSLIPGQKLIITVPFTDPETGLQFHFVEEGETVFMIAAKYGVAIDDLQQVNHDIDTVKLFVGQKIIIP